MSPQPPGNFRAKRAKRSSLSASASISLSATPSGEETLSVSTDVVGLQFDVTTAGVVTLLPGVDKLIESDNDGVTYIIYSLDDSTFTGEFATCSKPISAITNIIASDADGDQIEGVTINY